MQKMILVEFTDGTTCRMIPAALNLFLQEDHWIRGFQRSSGWVRVGLDPLRSDKGDILYFGRERRQYSELQKAM